MKILFIVLFYFNSFTMPQNCINPENVEKAKKFLVQNPNFVLDNYQIKLEDEMIVFQKENYSIFKIKENKLIVLSMKKSPKLEQKGHEIFCKLIKKCP